MSLYYFSSSFFVGSFNFNFYRLSARAVSDCAVSNRVLEEMKVELHSSQEYVLSP